MRAWFNYILIILVSSLCTASVSYATPLKTISSIRVVVIQAAVTIEHHGDGQHCDQPDDSEVLTVAYSQHSTLGPAVPFLYHDIKAAIYPDLNSSFTHGQNNVPIQPFYHQLLFPFHGFW